MNPYLFLILFLTSGIRITLPFSDQPKIIFEGDKMMVGNETYLLDNVQKWMVGDPEMVGIEDVITVTSKVKSSQAKVFNAAGVEVSAGVKTDSNGRLQVDLKGLPAGIYVIRFGTESLKVTKR